MKSSSFTTQIEVSQTPEIVFKCLQDVSKWWGKEDFAGSGKILNDEFTIKHGDIHYSKQKLIEVVPNEKIVWLVTDSTLDWLQRDKHEWTNTKMIFDIIAKGDKTLLQFTHEGLVPAKECYAMCRQGWSMIISEWLFHFIHSCKKEFIKLFIINSPGSIIIFITILISSFVKVKAGCFCKIVKTHRSVIPSMKKSC